MTAMLDVKKLPKIISPRYDNSYGSLFYYKGHAVIELPIPVLRYRAYKNRDRLVPASPDFKLYGPISYWHALKRNDRDPEPYFTKYVIVLDPEVRPIVKIKDKAIVGQVNKKYAALIRLCQTLKRTYGVMLDECTEEWSDDYAILDQDAERLQRLFIQIVEEYLEMLSGKYGLIRWDLMGCTIDFSGRAVIIPDPSLKTYQIRLPKEAKKLWSPELIRQMLDRGEHVSTAVRILKQGDYDKLDWSKVRAQKKRVLFGRQPTLWRFGCVGVDVVDFIDADALCISPTAVEPKNADMDGDTIFGVVKIWVDDEEFVCHLADLENYVVEEPNKELA